jgi:2'-5' RNA ligase
MEPVPGDGALAVVLPEELHRRILPWRRAYDAEHIHIPSHITMVYPPFVRELDWVAARPRLVQVLARFPAFDTTIGDVGVFSGEPLVLWLKPEDEGHLARIHTALAEAFPAWVRPMPWEFVPHVTIGFFDSEAALEEARGYVLSELEPMRWRVSALSYLTMGRDEVWRVSDRLALGSLPDIAA